MKQHSDELFLLIKSLTPSEKRYFKMVAPKHTSEKNNYEKLFDLYNDWAEHKPYDERAFKKEIARKNVAKNFAENKVHLYELVLKTLCLYNAEKNDEGRMKDLIQRAQLLIGKGLFQQSEKILNKAWEIAEQRELPMQKLRLLSLKREVDTSPYNAKREQQIKQLKEQRAALIQQIILEEEATQLKEQLLLIYLTKQMQEKKEEVNKIWKGLNALEKKPNLTFDTINIIVSGKCIILSHRKEYKQGTNLCFELIELFENEAWRMKEKVRAYLTVVSNCMSMIYHSEQYEKMLALLERLKNVEPPDERIRKEIEVNYLQYKLLYCLDTDKPKEALYIIPDLKKSLKNFEATLTFNQKINLSLNFNITYFKNREFGQILTCVQELYQLIGREKRYQESLLDHKFYEFVAHYELGNKNVLAFHLRNTQNFCKVNKLNTEFTDSLLKHFKELLQSKEERSIAKQKLKSQIEKLKSPESTSILKVLLLEWLQA